MSVDWRRFCTGKRFLLSADSVEVCLPGGRKQKVRVAEESKLFRLTSTVLAPADLADLARAVDIRAQIWLRNRSRSLVGFRVDKSGRLVGEAWVPKAGLTQAEFRKYLLALASHCDSFEAVLTGADRE